MCDIISGIEMFNFMELQSVVDLICDEYLQIIVIILVYFKCSQVVDILVLFDE